MSEVPDDYYDYANIQIWADEGVNGDALDAATNAVWSTMEGSGAQQAQEAFNAAQDAKVLTAIYAALQGGVNAAMANLAVSNGASLMTGALNSSSSMMSSTSSSFYSHTVSTAYNTVSSGMASFAASNYNDVSSSVSILEVASSVTAVNALEGSSQSNSGSPFTVTAGLVSVATGQRVDTLRAQFRSNLNAMSGLQSEFTKAKIVAGAGATASVLVDTGIILSGGVAASSAAARAPFINGTSSALGRKAAYELSVAGSRAAFDGAVLVGAYDMVKSNMTPTPTPGGVVQRGANSIANRMINNVDAKSQNYAQQNTEILTELAAIYGSSL